jgi:hypothetical protein
LYLSVIDSNPPDNLDPETFNKVDEGNGDVEILNPTHPDYGRTSTTGRR